MPPHSPIQRFYEHKSQNIFGMNNEMLHSTKATKVISNTVMILGKNKKKHKCVTLVLTEIV